MKKMMKKLSGFVAIAVMVITGFMGTSSAFAVTPAAQEASSSVTIAAPATTVNADPASDTAIVDSEAASTEEVVMSEEDAEPAEVAAAESEHSTLLYAMVVAVVIFAGLGLSNSLERRTIRSK
ncbi:hypothetical protein D2E26_0157 [Bifidobacterium dolichotidis]|uniref:Uncharacterized protein n=1 Tax=Bifidobacterium dolichotidis TaxID=2306976 RepID=A0A430FRU9_9BIFI|nr:hypothetical protein [Bifidobacterium dolichotidis]RSX55594.1 hypothetical protein D2E26_0157 [Bifidobacterium dolichotidis]